MTCRLHIDVTSLWNRRAPPVGISRVVTELAYAVRQMSESNTAWRYDSRWRRLVKVSWKEFDRLVVAGPYRDRPAGQSGSAKRLPSPIGWMRTLALRIARKLSRLLPGFRLFPRVTSDDRFIFADFIHDWKRITIYRDLIESTDVRPVLYCHDVIPILFPQFVHSETTKIFESVLSTFLRGNSLLLCNSYTTLNDLLTIQRGKQQPMVQGHIISPGCDIAKKEPDRARGRKRPTINGRYLLYVSTIEIRKNHRVLLDAYAKLIAQGEDSLPTLLLVGHRGWLVDDLLRELDSRAGAARHVTIMDHIDDEDLQSLYRGALFTLYPSFYEGWGIPVSEALGFGKFCLCSDRGSLPEAGAGFVELLDPSDSERWAARISHYLHHPDDLSAREERIRTDFAPRLWSDFRQDVVKALACG